MPCPASGRFQFAVIGYDLYVDGLSATPPRRRTRLIGFASMVESGPVAGNRRVQ